LKYILKVIDPTLRVSYNFVAPSGVYKYQSLVVITSYHIIINTLDDLSIIRIVQ